MSDFSSIDNVIAGKTVNLANTTPTTTTTPKSVGFVDPVTGNPPNSVTNTGTLGSGIPSGSGFGDNMITRMSDNESSLGNLINNAYSDPAMSRFTSSSKEMSDGDKRLNVIRSRAARSLYTEGSSAPYSSDRGPISYMRLLKNKDYDPKKSVQGGTEVKVDAEITKLISEQTGTGFSSFFLTDISMQHSEKAQILTTFGDNEVVYYFGKQPLIVNISGFLS